MNFKYTVISFFLMLSMSGVFGQVTLSTSTGSGYNVNLSANWDVMISFVIENNTNDTIVIDEISNYFATSHNGTNLFLWYSDSNISGPAIVSSPGWTNIGVSGPLSIPSFGEYTAFSNINYLILPNSIQRFVIQSTDGLLASSTTTGPSPSIFTSSGISLLVGDFQINGQPVGKYGYSPNLDLHTGFFLGSVNFIPFSPCNGTPVVGSAQSSSPTVCLGDSFYLTTDSVEIKQGIKYQWQKSIDNVAWSDLPGDTTASIFHTATDTAFYRLKVSCGTDSTFSDPVFVIVYGHPLSGNYTINSAQPTWGTNFSSFTDLSDALNCGGVSGPVVVDVVASSGPYTEAISLSEIPGASTVNSIKINGNGNTLQYWGTSNFDYTTIFMRGTSHLEIDSLHILANDSSFGVALKINSGSEHITLRNCSIKAPITNELTAYNTKGCIAINSTDLPVISNYGANASFVTIENNYIEGGAFGISMYGLDGNLPLPGNKIINNILVDQRNHAIICGGQENIEIFGNDISRPTINLSSNHNFTGISVSGTFLGGVLKNNRIHNTNDNIPLSTNTFSKGIEVNNVSTGMTANAPLLIANNLVYSMGKAGNRVLIMVSASNHVKVFHNTLVMDDPGFTGAGYTRMINLQNSSGANIDFKNNIMYLDRGGSDDQYFLHHDSQTLQINSDRNVFFTPNINLPNVHIARTGGTNYSSLLNWQQASSPSYDQNSVFSNPLFKGGSTDDFLRPQSGSIKGIGENLSNFVPVDYDGVSRPTNPDAGVYQFDPISGPDMTIVGFTKPEIVCGDSVEVAIEVENLTIDPVQTILINWMINGVLQSPITITDSFYQGNKIEIPLGSFVQDSLPSYHIHAQIDSIFPGIDIDSMNNFAEILDHRNKLNGHYTLNKNASQTLTNFTSFNAFANALHNLGICGPVILDVEPQSGPYTENVQFNFIQGVSSTDTILINGNGNTIQYDPNNFNFQRIIGFDSASYIYIDSLNIHLGGTQGGWGVFFTNISSHLSIRNCSITMPITTTSTNYVGMVASGSNSSTNLASNTLHHTLIENNYIEGGYFGINLNAANPISSFGDGNKIINNTLVDQANRGIYTMRQQNLLVFGNDISRPTQSTNIGFTAITANQGTPNSRIENNRIHNTSNNMQGLSPFVVAIDIRNNSNGNNPLFVCNNQVHDVKGEGFLYGIYSIHNSNVRFYHNTIELGDSNLNSNNNAYGIYNNGTCNQCELRNNIFYVNHTTTANSYLSYFNSATNMFIDRNVYFAPNMASPNMHFSYFTNNAIPDFASWQQLNNGAFDQNSIEINPFFIGGTGDDKLRPTAAAISQLGFNLLATVPKDFEGTPRTTPPDPGVYQFPPLPCTQIFNFEIDTVYPGSAELSWESLASEWQVEWSMCGFSPGMGTGITDSNVTVKQGYELSGLPRGQCVCVFIKEVCDSNTTGSWSMPFEICVPSENDLEMRRFIDPKQLDCGGDSSMISVRVFNHGLLDATGFNVVVDLSGDITGTITTNYSGVVASATSVVINVGTFNLSSGGNVTFTAYIDWPADSNSTNDTLQKVLDIQPTIPLEIFSSVDTICGTNTVMFYTNPNQSSPYLHWYDADSNLIGIGDSIVVPQIDSAFTIRLEHDSLGGFGTLFAGPLNASFHNSAGNFTGLSAQSLIVEAYEQVTLLSATVHPSGTGILHVEVREIPGSNVIYNFPVPVSPASPGAPVTIPLNIVLPPGEYELGANSAQSSVGLLRNTHGATFPYGNPNVFEITSTTFAMTRPESYYFYYNIEVKYGSCPRTAIRTRTLPLGIAPNADFNYVVNNLHVDFYNTSGASDSVFWDFSGLGTAFGDTVSFQFPTVDSFEVCMTARNKCFDETICKKIYTNNISVITHPLEKSLRIYPNPNNGEFSLMFDLKAASDVSIELHDMRGRIIWHQSLENYFGKYEKSFDQSRLSSGSYLLRINTRNGIISRKVIINK
ncbi:MAG: T9SS type A sorting domain-containing protein [Cryomorphaceae bacterium]|nr:T9SS type A sorting domain-containing protein [Cryomorphaceae bacterium]